LSINVNIDVRQRRWELRIVAAALLTCAFVPWTLRALSLPAQFAVAGGAIALALWGFMRVGWVHTRARLVQVAHTAANEWHLQRWDGGISKTATLHPHTRVFRCWLWLRFASGHSLLLGPGDIAEDEFRRLRVAVRALGDPEPVAVEGVA
jgi:hypothetical protein